MPPILRISAGLIFLLYPFLIYFGLREFQPRILSCILLVIAVLRFVSWKGKDNGHQKTINLYWAIAALIVILFTVVTGLKIGLYLYPFLVNLALLIFFYSSILNPPTIIEQIARRSNNEITSHVVSYTYKVTFAWCLFFILNGSISIISIFLSEEWWLFYNGFLSYILIACMFGVEYLCRIRFSGKQNV